MWITLLSAGDVKVQSAVHSSVFEFLYVPKVQSAAYTAVVEVLYVL